MNVLTVVGGPGGVNTYIVYSVDLSAVIIDPSDYALICHKLKEYNLNPVAVLLTHGHFDHVWALKELMNAFNIPFYIHEDDVKIVSNSKYNFSEIFGYAEKGRYDFKSPITVKDGDVLDFGNLFFKVIHTPGHTPGGVCYQIDNCLFTGDTLFFGTVGRTDCYFADHEQLLFSLKKFSLFDRSTVVYPGHGRISTIGAELLHNPFLR